MVLAKLHFSFLGWRDSGKYGILALLGQAFQWLGIPGINSLQFSRSGNKWDSDLGCCCSVAKLCLTLCEPMDCSMPGYSVLYYFFESVMLPNCSSSAAFFSFYLQSLSASGSFPMNLLFASGSQNTGASVSASVLPMNI